MKLSSALVAPRSDPHYCTLANSCRVAFQTRFVPICRAVGIPTRCSKYDFWNPRILLNRNRSKILFEKMLIFFGKKCWSIKQIDRNIFCPKENQKSSIFSLSKIFHYFTIKNLFAKQNRDSKSKYIFI